jgi:hypothetical protein
MARVLIDGKFVEVVDQYATTASFSITSFIAAGLSYGPHTILVEIATQRNGRSSGTDVIIDAFDVV